MRASVAPSVDVRRAAVIRALRLLHTLARHPATFATYSGHLLLAFCVVGTTSRHAATRRQALLMGRERARRWQQGWNKTRRTLDADSVMHEAIASYAAKRMGIHDERIRSDIAAVLGRHTPRELLYFDASVEGPPDDVPEDCACGRANARGRTACVVCGRRLMMLSRYEVWYYALTNVFFCERIGTPLAVPFLDVLRHLAALRPYPAAGARDFYQSIYAVTHTVYTLNGYGQTRLSPRDFPQEVAFLKRSMNWAIEQEEPDTVGEIVDSLAAFGARDSDPAIVRGRTFLVDRQDEDGGWGDEDDDYRRFHHVWAAIDGLRDYRWRRCGVLAVRIRRALDSGVRSGGPLSRVGVNGSFVSGRRHRRRGRVMSSDISRRR